MKYYSICGKDAQKRNMCSEENFFQEICLRTPIDICKYASFSINRYQWVYVTLILSFCQTLRSMLVGVASKNCPHQLRKCLSGPRATWELYCLLYVLPTPTAYTVRCSFIFEEMFLNWNELCQIQSKLLPFSAVYSFSVMHAERRTIILLYISCWLLS